MLEEFFKSNYKQISHLREERKNGRIVFPYRFGMNEQSRDGRRDL